METFEPGHSVAKYIKSPSPLNTRIVAIGVDTYIKMLLQDNFVHTDLHPGEMRPGGGRRYRARLAEGGGDASGQSMLGPAVSPVWLNIRLMAGCPLSQGTSSPESGTR